MSRTRGGSSRARGTGGFAKRENIDGRDESWHHNASLPIDTKPRDFYPEIFIPKPPRTSGLERAQYRRLQAFRQRVRDGPLYTVLSEQARVGKPSAKKAASFNPFEDMPAYTQKYKPSPRTLPRFDTQRYDIKLFPKELWGVLKHKQSSTRETVRGRARVSGHPIRTVRTLQRPETEIEDEDTQNKAGDEEDEEVRDAEDDTVVSESNPEEDFEDNDSEMAGDYNAQGYYDNGEDDADGIDGDGGDDGGFD